MTGTYPEPVTAPPFVQTTVPSPFGPIEVAATSRGVVAVAVRTTPDAVADDVGRRLATGRDVVSESDPAPDDLAVARRLLSAAAMQLAAYCAGTRRDFDLALDLAGRSAWDRLVLEGVARIPFGRTLGYGQVARAVGSPGAARAAGGAVSRNPLALVIPCHRVIAGDGTLGGYGGAWPADRDELLELKSALLAHEGVDVPRTGHAA